MFNNTDLLATVHAHPGNLNTGNEFTSGYFIFFICVLSVQVTILITGCIYLYQHLKRQNGYQTKPTRSWKMVFQDTLRITFQLIALFATISNSDQKLVLGFWIIFDIIVIIFWIAIDFIVKEPKSLSSSAMPEEDYISFFYFTYSCYSLVFGIIPRVLLLLDIGHSLLHIAYGFPIALHFVCLAVDYERGVIKRFFYFSVFVLAWGGPTIWTIQDSSGEWVWGSRWLLIVFFLPVYAFLFLTDEGEPLNKINEAVFLVSLSFSIWTANYLSLYPYSMMRYLLILWIFPSIFQTVICDWKAYGFYKEKRKEHASKKEIV